MAINKVVYGDQTLIDLTSDTATAEDVIEGKTFHDASGQLRTGTGTGGNVDDVEVNGTSVVTNKIAEITSYEEVTESEYEAIPVAERESNGIAYFIKDLNDESVQGYPPLIYSDEEREVGVWRDGKPLYQKTYSGLSVTSSTSMHTMGITLSGIETLVNAEACGGANDGRLIIFNVDAYIATNGTLYSSEYANGWTIRSITLQYTKTTDTAGSGTWNGQGGIAHHYSTNETVIGTWIDGKPLYEKTLHIVEGTEQTTKIYTTEIIDLNAEYIKLESAEVKFGAMGGNAWYTVPFYDSGSYNMTVGVSKTQMTITSNGWKYTEANVTVRYTKTTD